MSVDSKVSIFTTAMKANFINAYIATAKPAMWEKIVEIIPSTARIEHYTWMSPTPGMSKYRGHRRYGKIDTIKYSVENLEFDDAFEVLLRDIDDDQVGGYTRKAPELAERAKKFPGRWAMQHLAAGSSRPGFDGTSFFATTHSIGTGNNLLTATGSGNSDGLTYKVAALYTGSGLKPILYQQRKAPDLETNAGTPQSKEAKMVRYWIDMEGEAAYGYWWDAVQLSFTNLPTIPEFQTALGTISSAFRSFVLPKGLDTDDGEYIHEQEVFSAENMTIVGPPTLERIATQALNEMWIPMNVGSNTVASTNLYKGWASFIPSNFMN